MKYLALLFLIAVLVFGCKKDNTTPPADPVQTKQAVIKFIAYSYPSRPPAMGDSTFYFYDDQGRCIRVEDSYNTPSDFTYSGNIIRENIVWGPWYWTEIVYHMRLDGFPDSVIATDYSLVSAPVSTASRFEYDSTGKLLRGVYQDFYNRSFQTREFTIESGNITLITPQTNKAGDTLTRHYDLTRLNTIQNPFPSKDIRKSKNLLVREEHKYGSNKYTNEYEYTFDSFGRVVTQHELNKKWTATYVYH